MQLTELVKYGRKLDEKMKGMPSEINENVQGTSSDGKETGTQINNLEQKEEISTQQEQNEETRIQKNKERLRKLWDNYKCSNIQIIGEPEGEQEQEIENLFEQIMKENSISFARLGKFSFIICSSKFSISCSSSSSTGTPIIRILGHLKLS